MALGDDIQDDIEGGSSSAESESSNDPSLQEEEAETEKRLSNMPLEVFCKIASKLPISKILSLGTQFEKLEGYITSDVLWIQLIQRDFGRIEAGAYQKQCNLVTGKSSAKAYYMFLLDSFDAKVDKFFLFSTKYHEPKADCGPSARILQEAKPAFDKVHQTLNEWKQLTAQQKLDEIQKYHNAYLEIINFLAFQKIILNYEHTALRFTIGHRFDEIAIDLIRTPGIDLNFYHPISIRTILMNAALIKNDTIVRLLCETPGIDLHIKDIDGSTALAYTATKKEIKVLILYHMLKTATPDAALRILLMEDPCYFTKGAVYQHILSLVNETKDDNAKLNILENAIAIVDGKPVSALSYYFHVIKSPYNDIVKKIKNLIEEIKSNTKSKIEIVIEKPTVTLESISNRPEDIYLKPEVLLEVNNRIETRNASDLEFKEKEYAEENGLYESPATKVLKRWELYKAQGAQGVFCPFPDEATDPASSSQQQSQDQNRSIPIVANTVPSNADHIHKTKTFPVYYLRTSLIGSLAVGLILGLILGFGFDLSTASSAIGAVVSVVSTFGLSLSSYYFAAKYINREEEPLLFNVDKTNERELTLMNKSHIIDNSTNKMQNTADQGVVAAPGAPGYAAGRICPPSPVSLRSPPSPTST